MPTTHPERPVGALLRGWRRRAGLSQLELALRAESSARHISFVETGRARPSEEMVLRLAEHLHVPVRERNALLVAAGYAPRYPETPLDDPALAPLRAGLERMVTAYEPFPALVVDGGYRVVAANRGIALLLAGVAPHLLRPPLNALRLTLHPEGLAPRIRNFREWRAHLLEQTERQLALVRSAPLRALYEEVAAYPLPPGGEERAPRPPEPPFALPLLIEEEGRVLSFVSTIATFNTPADVTVSELAVETFLPADQETARHLRERDAAEHATEHAGRPAAEHTREEAAEHAGRRTPGAAGHLTP
ncbi:helix-turn-helix domain-containing protein [Streptomyces sp. JJ36]|uniref:helix-turn-helix domain-containing protein n=1 Tax=Streptomyces sp. JJ36 TaxID=2736645 RepID=UPI001F3196D2|nr:helix-turn-helix transcriptional regulator [Streptomyces sp. JJ36]MCF6526502.1 helix-turn-helix transcriptional regulator [Streptomyces sp. JJ36]